MSYKSFLFGLLLYLPALTTQAQKGFFIKSADSTPVYVEETGQGNPIVFLAGGPGIEPEYMMSIMQQLAPTNRCLLLHQRGTGRTKVDSLNKQTLALERYIADIEAVRQYIKADQITLVGHSWGGMLGQLYTGQHPQQVKRLLLIGSGGPSLQFATFYSDNILMRLRETDLQAFKKAQDRGNFSEIIQALTPGYFYDRNQGLAFQRVATPPNQNAGRINQLLLDQYGALGKTIALRLTQYKGPVCIIQGRQDPIDESTAYEIKQALPQAEVYFIERSGHLPWLEAPLSVQSFFKRLIQCSR